MKRFLLVASAVLATAFSAPSSPRTPRWQLIEQETWLHPSQAYEVVSETFESQTLPLAPGEMIFTNPRETPLTMPNGTYAITGFIGEVVDDSGRSVPLSEVYDHHWIALNTVHRNPLCGPEYVFGIGAESRNTPAQFGDGYGYVVNPGVEWGGNIHLLHDTHLSGADKHQASKECNECWYAPGKGKGCTKEANGTFDCCGEQCQSGEMCKCPTVAGAPTTPTGFRLRYRLNYTRDVQAITPVVIGVFTTPNCQAFYDVERNDETPETLASTTFKTEQDVTVVLAIGHQHVGAINISLFVNNQLACASYPTYGTESGVAGNEKGFLVKMSHCIDGSTGPIKLRKGDSFRLDSWYWVGSNDPRTAPIPGGSHLNVMGYMYTAFTVDGTDSVKFGSEPALKDPEFNNIFSVISSNMEPQKKHHTSLSRVSMRT